MEYESNSLEKLVDAAEKIAKEKADGHLTIFRFTTGWKCMIGTPNLDIDGREEVMALPAFPSIEEALKSFIET